MAPGLRTILKQIECGVYKILEFSYSMPCKKPCIHTMASGLTHRVSRPIGAQGGLQRVAPGIAPITGNIVISILYYTDPSRLSWAIGAQERLERVAPGLIGIALKDPSV